MKNILGILSVLFIITVSVNCSRPTDNKERDTAVALYKENINLLRIYIDSMKNATDSATVFNIGENFDKAMVALHYAYPSNTDLNISEGENDTIILLTERLISIRDSLLYSFGHSPLTTDTIK